MSADDFQTKYASVMESMMRSAVAETTKLFETMVDELKAEISTIRKENEDLKTRCSQFENAKSRPIAAHAGESEPPPGPTDRSERRDTAVQCDLVPSNNMLVEQCQRTRNQEQQCNYGFHNDHDYGEGNTPTPYVKTEMQEEIEPTTACRQLLSNHPDSTQTSACGTEKEGLPFNQGCSNGSMTVSPETRVAVELPCMGMDSILQRAQNLSLEHAYSQVISLAAVTYGMEEKSGVGLKISEIRTRGTLITSADQAAHQQSEGEPQKDAQISVNETSNEEMHLIVQQSTRVAKPVLPNTDVANDKLKPVSTEGEASSQPGAVCRKRGRPSKKTKHLQQPVKETSKSTSTDVQTDQAMPQAVGISTGVRSPEKQLGEPKTPNKEVADEEVKSISTEGEARSKPGLVCRRQGRPPKKTKHSQQPVKEMLDSPSTDQEGHQAPSAVVSPANKSLNPQPAESSQQRERRSSVTLQDAILLVEAMNQSTAKNTGFTSQRTALPQIQCSLQTVDEDPVKLLAPGSSPQTPHDVAVDLAELSTSTQLTVETTCDASRTTHTSESSKPQVHIMVPIPQQPNSASSSRTDMTPSSLNASSQTVVSLKQHMSHPWITTAGNPNNPVLNKIIVVPRAASSIATQKITALSPTQLSTVVSAVAASQKNSSIPVSMAAGLPVGVFSLPSVSPKTIYITSTKSNPAVPSPTSATSTQQQSATLPFPKITVLIPRPQQQSQETLVQTTKQEAAEPAPEVSVSLPLLIPSSQQESNNIGTQTASNHEDTTTLPLSIKQSQPLSNDMDTQTESDQEDTKSSIGIEPLTVSPEASLTEQKFSPVIKLSRLPFPISTEESVLISRLPSNGSSEGAVPEKLSSEVKSAVSEMPIMCTEVCLDVKEPSSDLPSTDLDGASVNVCEQPSTPSEMSAPVLRDSVNMVVSGTASDLTSNTDKETKDCVLPVIQEKESAAFITLTSITPKDKAHPHLQMTKTQFLAQLAVSPVVQDPKMASANDFVDASVGDMTKLRKNSLVARLRSHLRIHLQASRRRTNPEVHAETQIPPVSAKILKLEDDSENESTTQSEPFPVTRPVDDDTSLNYTSNDPTFIRKSTPVSPRRSSVDRDGVDTENTKSTPGRSRSITSRRFAHVSPQSTEDGASTENTTKSPEQFSSNRDGPKMGKSTSARPRRCRSAREDASPKRTKSSPVRLSLTKNDAGPKTSTSESTPVSLRNFTFTSDGSSLEWIKRDSNSFSPFRYSNITDGGEITTQSARWPKESPRKIREIVLAKRSRSIQDSKKTLRLLNSKKLSKSKTLAKIKAAKKSVLQNGAKAQHLSKIESGCEALKRIRSAGVWVPPVVPLSSMAPPKGKSASLPSASKTHKELYPPSVSRHPIPLKAPPMVSPLQPLSVIGGRLLKNQCGECGCVFTSSVALESHVGLHAGHSPFSCTLCGKRFLDSKGLKRHGRVHRNGRIHVCQQCGKGFVYRFGLTKHIQMVHRRIKPFVCQICTKAFFTKRDVENHIRIHTGEKPFKCNLCERRFARRVELNVHLRWHNGEKRHWCTYCTKGFLDLNNLKRHLYTHTGEKPQACPHCPKHFKQSGHLKKHITNVHKL